MLIELIKNGKRTTVNDTVASVLIARKLAVAVVETRAMKADEVDPELAPRPKRQYRRRDITVEN